MLDNNESQPAVLGNVRPEKFQSFQTASRSAHANHGKSCALDWEDSTQSYRPDPHSGSANWQRFLFHDFLVHFPQNQPRKEYRI
jgi:hypothetical protein